MKTKAITLAIAATIAHECAIADLKKELGSDYIEMDAVEMSDYEFENEFEIF